MCNLHSSPIPDTTYYESDYNEKGNPTSDPLRVGTGLYNPHKLSSILLHDNHRWQKAILLYRLQPKSSVKKTKDGRLPPREYGNYWYNIKWNFQHSEYFPIEEYTETRQLFEMIQFVLKPAFEKIMTDNHTGFGADSKYYYVGECLLLYKKSTKH